jgi:hypothetical protein
MTLSAGLHENQTNIRATSISPAPEFAWGLTAATRPPRRCALASACSYDRFQNPHAAGHGFDGVTQQQYLPNPDFYPTIPPLESLAGNVLSQTQRVVDSNLSAPYIAQFVVGVDLQLLKSTTLSVNFINSRGVHMLRTRNIHTPFPGTSTYPYGNIGNVYLYESTGFLDQRQLMFNFNTRFHPRVMLFGFYMLGRAKGDTDNVGSFPANTIMLPPTTAGRRSTFTTGS